MDRYQCDGDCEKTCSGRQICPLMNDDEYCKAEEMDISEYIEYLETGHVCEE